MSPSIAVVIPTFNRLQLLQEAIISVRRQTRTVSQIIVVDDGSTDETLAWCGQQDDITLCISHRQGPSAARNLGAGKADHEWIAFLDSDDVWHENYIQEATQVIQQTPDCRFVIFNFELTDKTLKAKAGRQGFVGAFPAFRSSEKLFSLLFPQKSNSNIWHGHAQFQALFGNWMQPSGLVIQRSLWLEAGGFNERLWRCEDMDFLLRIVRIAPATLVMTPLYRWRQGQTESLASDSHSQELRKSGLRVMSAEGLKIAHRQPLFFPVWLSSVLWMVGDLIVGLTLRLIRRFEGHPHVQGVVQTLTSLLNIVVPVVIAHEYLRADFASYRTFSVYLSSVSALSLTSGLWSMIPFWNSQAGGEKKISAAWTLQCFGGVLVAVTVLAFSFYSSDTYPQLMWQCLAVSSAFLLPSVFLEQRLCFAGRGLLTSCELAALEILRSAFMMALVFHGHSLAAVFWLIPAFLAVRVFFLNFAARRIASFKIQKVQLRTLIGILRESLPIGLAAALTSVSAVFDRIYLSRVMSAEHFATVAAGSISLPVVTFLEQALVQKALPQLAVQIKLRDADECAQTIRSIIEKIISFSLPYSAGLFLFASDILSVIFSGRYQDSTTFFQLFSLANLLSCIPADIVSRAAGRSARIFLFSGFSAASTIIVIMVGYPLIGAAEALALSMTANFFIRAIFLLSDLRNMGVNIWQVIPRQVRLLRSIMFIFTLVFAKAISESFKLSPLLALIFAALVAFSFLPQLIADERVDYVKGKEHKNENA
jgi:O-antigen/teichoic acid export membrane protein